MREVVRRHTSLVMIQLYQLAMPVNEWCQKDWLGGRTCQNKVINFIARQRYDSFFSLYTTGTILNAPASPEHSKGRSTVR
jgi:hypothetical protein